MYRQVTRCDTHRSSFLCFDRVRYTMVKPKANLSVPLGKNCEGNNVKRSRDDLDRTDEDQIESLNDLFSRMQSMFDNTNKRIDSCKADLQAEITTLRNDVHQFKVECTSNINELSTSITKMRTYVHQNSERIRAAEKSNDLILAGVPYVSNEDVSILIRKVSIALGYTEQDLPLLYSQRLAKVPIANGATPPIVLQFAFKLARDNFYRRYLSVRNLSLIHIGFNVDKRIYINENMTDEARRIKGKAISLRRSGKLHAVFTKDGCVFIKPTPDDEAVMVRSLDELETFTLSS